jgi:hypothetical protein
MHVDAHRAAIDLAYAQVNKIDRGRSDRAFLSQLAEGLKRLHRAGDDHYGIVHSRLHDGESPWFRKSFSIFTTMTKGCAEM